MYHTAALAHAANVADLAVKLKLNSHFLFHCISSHDSNSGFFVSLIGKSLIKLVYLSFDRLEREYLTDNACLSDKNFLRLNAHFSGSHLAHFVSLFLAVSVTGVSVFGVEDKALSLAACFSKIFLRNSNRSTLDLVLSKNAGGRAHNVRLHKAEVRFFCRVFLYAAIKTVSLKALCSTHAAVYILIAVEIFL